MNDFCDSIWSIKRISLTKLRSHNRSWVQSWRVEVEPSCAVRRQAGRWILIIRKAAIFRVHRRPSGYLVKVQQLLCDLKTLVKHGVPMQLRQVYLCLFLLTVLAFFDLFPLIRLHHVWWLFMSGKLWIWLSLEVVLEGHGVRWRRWFRSGVTRWGRGLG